MSHMLLICCFIYVFPKFCQLWELKMKQNGAIQGPIDHASNSSLRGANAPITPVHHLNVPYEVTEENETPIKCWSPR